MKIIFNRRNLIRWKIYIDRSRMYIGYIQFFLIGVVFLKEYQDTPWGKTIFDYALISIPIGLILFIFLSLLLGYFDSKLGLRQEELRNLSKSNPVMMEMLEEMKEMNKKLELLNQKSLLKP
jgi:uncharacterized membrane protein